MAGRVAVVLLAVLALGDTSAVAKPRTLVDHLVRGVPAPPSFNVVFDNPKDAGGIDPATGKPWPIVGQYADEYTNTVHSTKGFGKRAIAQDVGQLFGANVLDDGQRYYFARLLGVKPDSWGKSTEGSLVRGYANATADEAFGDYYALAATGGLAPGVSMAWGDVSIDRRKLRKFSAAINRLGQRQHLPRLNLTHALAVSRRP